MTKINQIYKCPICGNIVTVIHEGAGELVCCGNPMHLFNANTTDASTEKHVPVVKKTENGIKVIIGETLHPMEPEHYIEWIEVIADGISYRKYLHPGEKPEAEFCIKAQQIEVREYCNLHGLWKS